MGSLVGFIKSLLGICATKLLSPGLWSLEDGKVRVKLGEVPELSQAGGAVYLEGQGLEKPVLILRTREDKYLAFASVCPHMKRKIDPVPGEPFLRCCSVMHSTFDYEGRRISGPANGSLTKYGVELDDGNLVITL